MSRSNTIINASSTSVGIATFILGYIITISFYAFHSLQTQNPKQKNEGKSAHNQTISMVYQRSFKDKQSSWQNKKTRQLNLPNYIREEQLSRNLLYFGVDGMKSITNANILIVGLGAVGSHAAHMLARAGVRYMRLIDFDQVTLSSLNRHACSTLTDVGTPKVIALKRFLEKICPDPTMLEIDARVVQMYIGNPGQDDNLMNLATKTSNPLLENDENWDFVIDAIDDVQKKARLLTHCVRHKIRVISCMGADGINDVTRLHIADLRTASRDPRAFKLRKSLERMNKSDGIKEGESFLEDMEQLAVVYSSEKIVVRNLTEKQLGINVERFGDVNDTKIRVLPTLSTMPAIMGQSMAAMAICKLGKKPFSPLSGKRVGRNSRHRIFQHLKNREKRIRDYIEASAKVNRSHNDNIKSDDDIRTPCIIDNKWVGPIQIDVDDVEYILSEVWGNRCCVTGESVGTVLELSRWDLTKPSNCQNLVVLGKKSLQEFDEAALTEDGRNSVPIETRKKIKACLQICRVDSTV